MYNVKYVDKLCPALMKVTDIGKGSLIHASWEKKAEQQVVKSQRNYAEHEQSSATCTDNTIMRRVKYAFFFL